MLSMTDAVVLWDWALGLPREWRFVSAVGFMGGENSDHSLLLLDMDDTLDTCQDRIFVLSVSVSFPDAPFGMNRL